MNKTVYKSILYSKFLNFLNSLQNDVGSFSSTPSLPHFSGSSAWQPQADSTMIY